MQRLTPGGDTDTEVGGAVRLLQLKPTNPRSYATSASETEHLPKWKRFGMKYRDWIIIAILVIVVIALSIRLAVVDASRNRSNGSDSTKENATCFTSGCLISGAKTMDSMDTKVSPCNDFYKFACGGFEKSTVLSYDEGSRSITNVISEQYRQQLNEILRDRGGYENPVDLKAFEIAKNLYKMCMNTTAIEKVGVEPLLQLLRQLGRWPLLENNWTEDFDWKDSTTKFREFGYVDGYFIGFAVDKGSKTRSSKMIVLDQAKLGIPREHLIKGMEDEMVKAYFAYMTDIGVALGFDKLKADHDLRESLKFEIKLANITLPDETRRNINASENNITVSEMNNRYPGVNWEEFINKLLPSEVPVSGNDHLLVLAPSYFSGLMKIIASTSKRDQANYAMWRLIESSVKYLTEDVTAKYAKFQAKVNPEYREKPRWQECVSTTVEKMPISIGAMYARKYLKDKEVKKSAVDIVTDMRTAFDEILKKVDWMDQVTKDRASKRLANMTSHIAYPDEYLDDQKIDDYYKALVVHSEDLLNYVLTLSIFESKKSLVQRKEPVMKDDWTIHPFSTEANVVWDSIGNDLQVPAGILQGGYFDPERPQYMNYGALGYLIGRELTRSIDNEAREQDGMEKLADWWTAETKKNYSKKAQCIIDQYTDYVTELADLDLNGINTQRESIADNAAIKEAYLAYKKWVQRNGFSQQKLPGLEYTPAQLFWVSAANVWCTKYASDALDYEVTEGIPSPEKYRVIGAFSNMPEFATDFNCPLGSPMNPEHKCSVW